MLFVLILLSIQAIGQVAKPVIKTVKKDFNFKIDYVYQGNADTVILVITNGGKWGVKKGDQGKIFGTYNSNSPDRSQKELGFCTVVMVKGDTVGAVAKIYHPEIKDEMVKAGDYATLSISLPAKPYNVDSMVKAFPDLKDNFVKNVNPEELKNYKSKIPKDVGVLLYVVRENQLIIFTLTNETTKAKLINISDSELSAHVKDFTSILKYPFKDANAKPLKLRGVGLNNIVESAHSLAETGSDLYKILIEPIKEDIVGKTKLCIINNGELSSVPFQTIGKKDDKGNFKYLVEDILHQQIGCVLA